MMMKMLEAGGIPILLDNIRIADEDNPNGYYEFQRVKKLSEGDFSWLDDAKGKAVKVISFLVPYLPSNYTYRILFMQRALPEVLASQRKMLIHRGEDPNKLSDDEMTRLFEQHLQQVKRWISVESNVHCLDVYYNQLLKQPSSNIRQVNQFLDNQLDEHQMVSVIDPLLHRQKPPMETSILRILE